ncbi:MAG: hydroxyacid dehydrogenase [Ilumatobacteraceae bacterium]
MSLPHAAVVVPPALAAALLDEPAWSRLAAAATVLEPSPVTTLAELDGDALARVEVLLTSWASPRFDEAVLATLPSLKMVAHAAGTVKHVVTPAAFARDIRVTSAAAANAVPVAEFTFAAILMCGKDVFAARDRVRSDRGWRPGSSTFDFRPTFGNRGRTIGVVGASMIGRLVIERLRSIDCTVLVADPYLTSAEAVELGVTKVGLDELCAASDVVSVHAPELSSTRHMIAGPQLGLMRDGAWVINTARGALIDAAALQAELVSSRLNAFIDTPDPEPLPTESPLYDLPNVVLTPHLAGSSGNEIGRLGALAVTEIERYASGLAPLYPVLLRDLERIA